MVNYFAFLDFKKNLKIQLSAVGKIIAFVLCLHMSTCAYTNPWLPAILVLNHLNLMNTSHERKTHRISHRRCSVWKDVLRNFAKFTGKHVGTTASDESVYKRKIYIFRKKLINILLRIYFALSYHDKNITTEYQEKIYHFWDTEMKVQLFKN